MCGLVVTLEAPSALSVGLCMAHMATDKRAWLERLGVEVAWPMSGKPREVHVDNASEFHSEALRRGCDQHGIKLEYRPKGMPYFGGIIERLIGTMMQMVHELPGTTFSNPSERGDYDSDSTAVLTMANDQIPADVLDPLTRGPAAQHRVQHVVSDHLGAAAVPALAGGGVQAFQGGLADGLAFGLGHRGEEREQHPARPGRVIDPGQRTGEHLQHQPVRGHMVGPRGEGA